MSEFDSYSSAAYHGVAFPTEKWLRLAASKFEHDYVLIANLDDQHANFFKVGKGYEPCPFRIARALIEQERVTPVGSHYLGQIYRAADPSLLRVEAELEEADEDYALLLDAAEELPAVTPEA